MAQQQTVLNHDIVGLYDRINRFIEEAQKAASSSVSLTNQFDVDRLKTYLDAIDRYHNWVRSMPQLDLPETTPREYKLLEAPDIVDIENDDMDAVVRMLVLARDEVTNSQSARLGAGMLTPDSNRLIAIVGKARAFVNDYILPTQPLDLPESSPNAPMSGSGRTGI